MDDRARVGLFQGPSGPYGVALPTVHPLDNDVSPDPVLAEQDRVAAASRDLYEELQNKQRDFTRKSSG